MDSTDDDFGELYIDDKVQASAALAGDIGFVKPFEEQECAPISGENKGFVGTVKPESRGEAKKFGGVCVEACAVNRSETNEESEYSDSEDDLNIVLKEDDSKALPVACGSNINNPGYVETSQACSFRKRRTGNWCAMPNSGMVNGRTTMDALANNVWMNPSLGMPHCGYNFSHTWSNSRSAFDANQDMFEKKPWRNPGTDINDFFNFGFNEQSWKDYCNPLLKGRAIEVEDGTPRRTPSVNLRHPRDLDPDVVIQIPVTNDVEELSRMTPVGARYISKTSNKASRSEEFHSDIGEDFDSSGDSMKEDVSVGREDENTGSFRGEQSPPKKNCCSWEATPCDKEIIEEEKEETCWNSDKADSSSVERGSSLGDHFRFSPASSYSIGKTEESEDSETESSTGGATDDQREASTPPQRTRFLERDANTIKSGERSGTKHSRHRRSHEDPSIWHSGKVDYGAHRRTQDAIFKDASSTPDPDLGKKLCSGRRSLYRDSSKSWQNGPLSTLQKVETEGRGFPHSNREKHHGRSYSAVELDRDREHRFGWRNNKEISHGRSFDHSNGYKYEARLKEYSSLSSFNPNRRNSRLSFNKEEDRYGRQHCERKYGRERSPGLAYKSNTERNRYDWLGEPYYQDRIPITDMEYRYRFEYSSANGRHSPIQSRENGLHCRRRGDYDYNLHRHRYEDGSHRAESGFPFELAYREMYSFAEVGRRESERYEINEEFSEIDRRHHYTPDWHHDRFAAENDGHKYRIQDAWPSPSLSFRDSWYTKGSRGDSWRDDTRGFTTREYDRQNNQFCKDAPRDSWTGNLVHSDNVSIQDRLRYDNNWFRHDRRRYQLGDDIQCSMSKVTHSEHPSYADEMLVHDIRMSTHNRISTKKRPGYIKSHVHEIDERYHTSKRLRRDEHAFIKCQEPDDLIGRQGKLSNQSRRRFSNGGDTIEQQDHQKPRNVIGKRNEKATVQIQSLNEKEEGEIIEEERSVKGIEISEDRIQESLKKMEKRRERFKETELVVAKLHSRTEQGAKIDVTNQERPVRKRRWCAS